MRQLRLGDVFEVHVPPPGQIVVASYGGGVNTVAALVLMQRLGVVPRAIVMADPGSEWRATVRYRDEILPSWLDAVGFPRVTTIDRINEGAFNPRAWRLETLRDECMRVHSIPSIAYGFKKCSAKYKGDTQRWWIARQEWALAEWAAGRRITKVIGYDAGEGERVMGVSPNPWERARLEPWYPLYEAGLVREDCEDLISEAGLPIPPKSACTYCPNNTIEEWRTLRRVEPDRFAEAVAMSRNAEGHIDQPDVVGLMRCNEHGRRQLHVWADGGYGDIADEAHENPMPCECAL